MSLSREKLQYLHSFKPFSVICNHESFVKLNLPIFPVVVRKRVTSQKYFKLLAVKQTLIQPNPFNTLDATIFDNWELSPGSPSLPFYLLNTLGTRTF